MATFAGLELAADAGPSAFRSTDNVCFDLSVSVNLGSHFWVPLPFVCPFTAPGFWKLPFPECSFLIQYPLLMRALVIAFQAQCRGSTWVLVLLLGVSNGTSCPFGAGGLRFGFPCAP